MSNVKEWRKDGRSWEPGSESQSRRMSHEALRRAANGSHRHRRQRVQQLAGDGGDWLDQCVKRDLEARLQLENSNSLEPEVATLCRCLAMRATYLAHDRMDISESINCFRGHIQTPREGHTMWCPPCKMKKTDLRVHQIRLGPETWEPTQQSDEASTCFDMCRRCRHASGFPAQSPSSTR